MDSEKKIMIKCSNCGIQYPESEAWTLYSNGDQHYCDLDCKLEYAGMDRKDYFEERDTWRNQQWKPEMGDTQCED